VQHMISRFMVLRSSSCSCIFFFYAQESYTYRDPITEFLECLYVNFDFDGAQQKLRECETVTESEDFYFS
jgi:hypothetical protein